MHFFKSLRCKNCHFFLHLSTFYLPFFLTNTLVHTLKQWPVIYYHGNRVTAYKKSVQCLIKSSYNNLGNYIRHHKGSPVCFNQSHHTKWDHTIENLVSITSESIVACACCLGIFYPHHFIIIQQRNRHTFLSQLEPSFVLRNLRIVIMPRASPSS